MYSEKIRETDRRWVREAVTHRSLCSLLWLGPVTNEYQLAHKEEDAHDHVYTVLFAGHKERKLLYFETQDHLYSIEAYYMAKVKIHGFVLFCLLEKCGWPNRKYTALSFLVCSKS